MKNSNFLLLVLLLIWSSHCFIGFSVVGPLTKSAFTCLATSVPDADTNEPYVIIRAYQNSHSPAGIDPNAL